MRLCGFGVAVSPARAWATQAIVRSQAEAVALTVNVVRCERYASCGMVMSPDLD